MMAATEAVRDALAAGPWSDEGRAIVAAEIDRDLRGWIDALMQTEDAIAAQLTARREWTEWTHPGSTEWRRHTTHLIGRVRRLRREANRVRAERGKIDEDRRRALATVNSRRLLHAIRMHREAVLADLGEDEEPCAADVALWAVLDAARTDALPEWRGDALRVGLPAASRSGS